MKTFLLSRIDYSLFVLFLRIHKPTFKFSYSLICMSKVRINVYNRTPDHITTKLVAHFHYLMIKTCFYISYQ